MGGLTPPPAFQPDMSLRFGQLEFRPSPRPVTGVLKQAPHTSPGKETQTQHIYFLLELVDREALCLLCRCKPAVPEGHYGEEMDLQETECLYLDFIVGFFGQFVSLDLAVL